MSESKPMTRLSSAPGREGWAQLESPEFSAGRQPGQQVGKGVIEKAAVRHCFKEWTC